MAEPDRELGSEFRVGEWVVDGNALTATRADSCNPLEPRAFAVLRYLAERPGHLVSIDELMDALWRGAVVTPNAVTRIIAQLRKALEDDAKHPKYIQTVARTGYRLIAPVDAAPESAPPVRNPRVAVALVTVAAIAAVVFAGLMWLRPDAEPSVAVLPFTNLTGDENLEYLSDGVAEELQNALATLEPLDVSARSLSFRYRGDAVDPIDAASELGVQFIATGSLRRSGLQLRISARLIDARAQNQVWSETVDVTTSEVFSGQQRISHSVAAALAEALDLDVPLDASISSDRRVPDSAAYDLYLRGRHVWHRRGTLDLQPAVDAFTEAVRIDPEFAGAWAALASAYLTYPTYSPRGYRTWRLAKDAAEKALALDPRLAEPYAVLGTFSEARLDWALASAQFLEAVRLAPDNPTLAHWRGEHLAKVARYVEANEEYRRSISLDPTYLPARVDAGFGDLTLGHYETGLEVGLSVWERGYRAPVGWTGIFIGLVLTGDRDGVLEWIQWEMLGDAERALLERFVASDFDDAVDPSLADEIGAPETRIHYMFKMWLVSRLGNHGLALSILNDYLDAGRIADPRILWAPGVGLRQHPRFEDMLNRLRLVEYWEEVAWGDICRPVERRLVCADGTYSVPGGRE